jgi:hypothetical protein
MNTQVAQKEGQKTSPSFAGVELNGRKSPKDVVATAKGKSEAIRALAAAGYTTAQIAKMSPELSVFHYLDNGKVRMDAKTNKPAAIRYQHVRNVLNQPIGKKSAA